MGAESLAWAMSPPITAAVIHIHHHIYYHSSARKLTLILLSQWGRRVDLGTAGRVQQPVPMTHFAMAVVINTLPAGTRVITQQPSVLPLDHCDL